MGECLKVDGVDQLAQIDSKCAEQAKYRARSEISLPGL
jgi:hypothetical protein